MEIRLSGRPARAATRTTATPTVATTVAVAGLDRIAGLVDGKGSRPDSERSVAHSRGGICLNQVVDNAAAIASTTSRERNPGVIRLHPPGAIAISDHIESNGAGQTTGGHLIAVSQQA